MAAAEESGGNRSLSRFIPGDSSRRWALSIFLICIVVYALLIALVPRYRGVTSTDGDEPHYLIITQSLLEDGDLDLHNNYHYKDYLEYYQETEQTRLIPHMTPGRNDSGVSAHPPFISFLILPFFWLFGYRGPAFLVAFLFSLAAALTFSVSEEFVSRKIAFAVTLFFFLTYPLLFYSRLIYPDSMAVFFLALGTWSSYRLLRGKRPGHALLCGLSAGLLILLHPKFAGLAIALAVLFVMVARRQKKLYLYWFAPILGCVVVLITINYVTFGTHFMSGFFASAEGRAEKGFLGTSSLYGIAGLYLDRVWGIVVYAPLYLLFPHGLFLQKSRREWATWWAFFPVCIGLHTVLMGTFRNWRGGASPVPRFLVPLAPLFIICVAFFIDKCRHYLAYAAASVFAALQVTVTVGAFFFMQSTYGMLVSENLFVKDLLGDSGLSRFLVRVFPLYHPVSWRAMVQTIFWLAVLVATVLAARRYYRRHKGGKPSPLVEDEMGESIKGGAESVVEHGPIQIDCTKTGDLPGDLTGEARKNRRGLQGKFGETHRDRVLLSAIPRL